ncbi:MAG: hypothetical protein R3E39_05405 [Anaerolineae bacterium]
MADRLSSHKGWTLLILAAALTIVFHRLLLGEVFFWGLPSLQFYPWREYAFDLLRQGHLPLWNPYNGTGAPLLANYQSALLYPLNWLGLVLPLAWSMSVTAVFHLFIAGWGMWRFTGQLGMTELGRGVSTLAFGMTSYLVARLGTYPTLFVAAWMPWLLWASLNVMVLGRRRDVGMVAIFGAMQLLAGHAQTTWYSMLLVGAFSTWWGVTRRPIQWKRWLLLILGITLAAGIASAQLLPTAELLAQSQRSNGVDYDTVMNFSYSPIRGFNFLLPNFFGTPADGSYITEGAFFEDAVYVGLIPLISATVAVATWGWGKIRHAKRPNYFSTIPFWLIILIIGYVLALGKNSPIFPFLYENVPTFGMFQAPVRWHIWTVFSLSVLAGAGVGMWTRGYWVLFATRLAVAASIGATLLALIAPQFLPSDVTKEEGVLVIIRAVVALGVIGALAGILTLTQPESPTSRWYSRWTLAVLVVVGADLVYASWGLNPTIPAAFYGRRSVAELTGRGYWDEENRQIVLFSGSKVKDEKTDDLPYLEFKDYRVLGDRQDAFRTSNFPNLNMLDRLPLLNNFDPLLVGTFKLYTDLIKNHPEARDHLLSLAGVGTVYGLGSQPTPVVNNHNLPSVWLAQNIALDECEQQSIVKGLLVETPAPGMYFDCPDNLAIQAQLGKVEKIDLGYRVTIEDEKSPDGLWVIFSDTFYNDWVAMVDGQTVEIRQANLAFRAVLVSPGTHEVRFEYRPWWLWPGILGSVISVLVTIVLFRTRNPDNHAQTT